MTKGFPGLTTGLANAARRLVPRPVRQSLKAMLGMPAARVHPSWEILRHAGPVSGPHVVVDVGARNGWFFQCWKDWCPLAEVHAFEPDVTAGEALRVRFGTDPSVTVVTAGLGDSEGTLPFHILEGSRVSSSFLAPSETEWARLEYRTGRISTVEVPVTTLDTYLGDRNVDRVHILKIDVQGYELKVLEGARDYLARTGWVFVEAAVTPLYEGAPRFTRVTDYLLDRGFDLVSLRAWHKGDGALVETDLLFRNAALRRKAEAGRFYLELR